MFLDLLDTHPDHDQPVDLCLITYLDGTQRRLTVYQGDELWMLWVEKAQSQSYAWAWVRDDAAPGAWVWAEDREALLAAVVESYRDVLTQGYEKKAGVATHDD